MKSIIYLISGLTSGFLLIYSGVKMVTLHSVGSLKGNISITEAYYNDIGLALIGLGIFTGVMLIMLAYKN